MKKYFNIEDEGTTYWCDVCQMNTTISNDNPYGTCMCS